MRRFIMPTAKGAVLAAVLAELLVPSIAFGMYPLPAAIVTAAIGAGALLLGYRIGDKIVKQWYR